MARSSWFFIGTTTLALVLALALSVVADDSTVKAQPQPFHIFFGNVKIGASAASPGQRVEARIDNVNYANSFQTGRNTVTESGGTYGVVASFHVCGDTIGTANKEGGKFGDEIKFFVGLKPATALNPDGTPFGRVDFVPGDTTRVDLVVASNAVPVAAGSNKFACTTGDEPPTPTPVPQPPFIPPVIIPPTEDDDVPVDAEATATAAAATQTAAPTQTAIAAATQTAVAAPTQTAVGATQTAIAAIPTQTAVARATRTAVAAATQTVIALTPTVTPTPSPTPTITPTPSITPSPTPRVTPSITPSPTPRVTPSITPSPTPRVTPSVTPTITPSPTPTETPEPPITAQEIRRLAQERPEEAAEALRKAIEKDPAGAARELGLALGQEPDVLQAVVNKLAEDNPDAVVNAVLALGAVDAGAANKILNAAGATEAAAKEVGEKLAEQMKEKPEEVIKVLEATTDDTQENVVKVLESALDEDAESLGESFALADDTETIGKLVGRLAEEKTEEMGEAIAALAQKVVDEDRLDKGGEILATAVKTANVKKVAESTIKAAKENPNNVTKLVKEMAKDAKALERLGEELSHVLLTDEDDLNDGDEDARGLKWKKTGSPAPIDKILSKFQDDKPNARVIVTDVVALPSGIPNLPSGRIINSLMALDPENFGGDEPVANHVTLFVEKSWLDANQIHQWSVQFNRFDDVQDEWRPAQAKRIREDEERVFFTVVIPGFSLWAISGSTDVEPPEFRADDLVISPTRVSEGESVTISARVTNLSDQAAEYNASLWLNSQVDTVELIAIDAGATVPVSFTIAPITGEYQARIDRLVGSFSVGPVVVTPVAPTPEPEERVTPVATTPEPEERVTPVAPTPQPEVRVTPIVPVVARGVGVTVGAVVGVIVAIIVAGLAGTIYLRTRGPLPPPPPPPAGPAPEPAAPDAPEEPSPEAAEAKPPTEVEPEGLAAQAETPTEEPPVEAEAEKPAEEPEADEEEPPSAAEAEPEEPAAQPGADEEEPEERPGPGTTPPAG